MNNKFTNQLNFGTYETRRQGIIFGTIYQHLQNIYRTYSNTASGPHCIYYNGITRVINTKILSQLMYKVVNSSFVQSIAGKNNIELIILSGFLHDIGKGGDRIFDMYHKQKYNGEGDTAHPKFCMDLLLDPGKSYNHQLSTELNQIMALFKNPKICKLVLAVCAATHWEFGKLNKPLQYGGIQPKKYLNIIQNKLHIIKDRLDIEVITEDSFRTIVDICMLVSCSDIISSYNTELDKSLLSNLGFEMAEMKHRSEGGAWTKFKMNINHINLIKQVHTELEE